MNAITHIGGSYFLLNDGEISDSFTDPFAAIFNLLGEFDRSSLMQTSRSIHRLCVKIEQQKTMQLSKIIQAIISDDVHESDKISPSYLNAIESYHRLLERFATLNLPPITAGWFMYMRRCSDELICTVPEREVLNCFKKIGLEQQAKD